MSFTSNIKAELCDLKIKKKCCAKAELSAIICFGAHIRENCLILRTENRALVQRISALTKQIFGYTPVVIAKATPGLFEVQIANETRLPGVLEAFGFVKNARDMKSFVSFGMPEDITEAPCCTHAALRGAFLTSGSCAEPEKRYHLEISTNHFRLSRSFLKLMETLEIYGKAIARKNGYVIYLKGADYIHDFLGYAGATKSVMLLEETRVTKDFKNHINRTTNFEMANFNKSFFAGNAQAEAIEVIQKTIGIEALDDNLKEVAYLRLENPDLSLADLSQKLSTPISKSGINHRLKRITEIAERLQRRMKK